MKNARPWLIILASVLVGVIAVVLAARWTAQQASLSTRKVVVASRDIDVGTRLRPEMLQIVDWPANAPLKEPVTNPDTVVDRVVNAQVLRGEPILPARLAPPGEKGGLSAVLDEGKRAITVKVNEIVGVAGFALPGNYVDVMVNTSDESNKSISKIVLERILVLAVAQDQTQTGEAKPRVVNAVTLEVTPQEAEKIDLARSVGSLSLVLRSQVDKGSAATLGARKNDLLKGQAMTALPAASAPATVKTAQVGGPPERKVARALVGPRKAAAAKPVAAPAPVAASGHSVEVIRGMARHVEKPVEEAAP